MYSYEERKKAVELYIKFDKSASAVVRELGYPTTRMLTLWYREYLEEGDLHKKSRLQKGYTAEQKAAAIKYYQEHGRGLARTVKALGVEVRFEREGISSMDGRIGRDGFLHAGGRGTGGVPLDIGEHEVVASQACRAGDQAPG